MGVAAICAALQQRMAERRDARQYVPADGMFDVAGVRLRARIAGTGVPAVIFESGLGMDSTAWCLVQPELARHTRTVSYDRGGLGWSDPAPGPRTSIRIARELWQLLDAADVAGPYVLVGHSFGGMHVRAFAGLYGDAVAGVVLVDASPEGQSAAFRARSLFVRFSEEARWWLYRANALVARTGVRRLLPGAEDDVSWMPEECQPEARALALRSRAFDWTFTEAAACAASEAEVVTAGGMGGIPLVVLTALWRDGERGLTADDFNERWMALQSQLATLSTRSVHIVANTSAHLIPAREPELVVGVIRQLVDTWRREHPPVADQVLSSGDVPGRTS